MQIRLSIGGIGIRVYHQGNFKSCGRLKSFISEIQEESEDEIEIHVLYKQEIFYPQLPCLGEDLFCRYYRLKDKLLIEAKGAGGIPSAIMICENRMQKIRFELYPQMQRTSGSLKGIVALLPMRQILICYEAFLLHSSRIEVDGKAVLFTGPSGIGKTTQAVLWKKYEDALHLCNDRTIIRLENGRWNTYGYFEDGSEPIGDNKCLPLGAIVILKQADENRVLRINGKTAMKALMEQVFLDHWDYAMLHHAVERIVDLLRDVPVYCLQCVKDRTAAECLKDKLSAEGVIN